MPVHIPVKAEDVFEAAHGKGPGHWVIGYRTAREIKKMLDLNHAHTTPLFPWPGDTLLGYPVNLRLGYGMTFYADAPAFAA